MNGFGVMLNTGTIRRITPAAHPPYLVARGDDTTDALVAGQQSAIGLSIQEGVSKTQLETLKTRMEATKAKLAQVQATLSVPAVGAVAIAEAFILIGLACANAVHAYADPDYIAEGRAYV